MSERARCAYNFRDESRRASDSIDDVKTSNGAYTHLTEALGSVFMRLSVQSAFVHDGQLVKFVPLQ